MPMACEVAGRPGTLLSTMVRIPAFTKKIGQQQTHRTRASAMATSQSKCSRRGCVFCIGN